jgi:photosystem II stability/assembly factor-like uncharacterized protein
MKKVIYILMFLTFASLANAQWSEQTSGTTISLRSVSAVDNNVVWICGSNGTVLLTTNGGNSWTTKTSPNPSITLRNIWGIDANNALVTGSGTTAYVYKTTDGGSTWAQVFSQLNGYINAISNTGWTNSFIMFGNPVGGRWSIWRSNNDGTTWDSTGLYLPQVGSETGKPNSLMVLRDNTCGYSWFGTNTDWIYSSLCVNSFSQQNTGNTSSSAIWFNSITTGMVGDYGWMRLTTNSGVTWNPLTNPVDDLKGGICGSGTNWWVAGNNGVIYFSSNNGSVWNNQYSASGSFNHITKARNNNNNIWAVRSNGGISKFTGSIGIQNISTEIPSSYSLFQNYPNPFNPTTNIRYQITNSKLVILKIFDILGKEVETLVNEKQSPGTYEVDWNASQYPSGVYFYKLQSGDFVDTKRMILVK